MYLLIYSTKAKEQLKKLSKNIQLRVLSSLERCRLRPHSHIKKLVGSSFFSLRVGDYRIILDIQKDKLMILVVTLGHRKNIYKNI